MQTVWKIRDSEGLPRLRGDDTACHLPALRTDLLLTVLRYGLPQPA